MKRYYFIAFSFNTKDRQGRGHVIHQTQGGSPVTSAAFFKDVEDLVTKDYPETKGAEFVFTCVNELQP